MPLTFHFVQTCPQCATNVSIMPSILTQCTCGNFFCLCVIFFVWLDYVASWLGIFFLNNCWTKTQVSQNLKDQKGSFSEEVIFNLSLPDLLPKTELPLNLPDLLFFCRRFRQTNNRMNRFFKTRRSGKSDWPKCFRNWWIEINDFKNSRTWNFQSGDTQALRLRKIDQKNRKKMNYKIM